MDLDKKTLVAVGLSLLIIMVWPYFFPYETPVQKKVTTMELSKDSIPVTRTTESVSINQIDDLKKADNESLKPLKTSTTIEKKIVISDDYVERILTNYHGVRFYEYDVKKHLDVNGNYVKLINNTIQNGFTVELSFKDGDTKKLNETHFEFVDSLVYDTKLSESNSSTQFRFKSKIRDKYVYQTYTFYYNQYDYDVSFDFTELRSELTADGVQYQWLNGMPYTEQNQFEDENMSLVFMWGNEKHRFDTNDPEDGETFVDEDFKYFVVRSKYFMSAVIPTYDEAVTKIRSDVHVDVKGELKYRRYDVSYKSSKANSSFKIYVGPYDLNELERYEKYELEETFLNASSYEGAFRWITHGVHFMLLKFADVFGNYGLAIIFFTISIKLLLFPLTKKSYQGMSAMKDLQPKMAKIKKKYADDPQMQQKKMMQMYKDENVNPLGGCLPMLLQMPLLLALFQVFRASIEFRGASFLWIQNLAAPDAFPIGLESIGFATINLLPILLAVSQVWTSKQTMTDPNQKMLAYIMPVMFLFLFYNWNAALNFYYLLFNVLTSIQQKFIHRPEAEVEEKVIAKPEGFAINEKASKVTIKKKDNMFKKK